MKYSYGLYDVYIDRIEKINMLFHHYLRRQIVLN